jgi:murein DD-endopeptidase MepM/ murein hydrolase activator NlpD
MREDRWNIVVMADEAGPIRQIRVPGVLLRLVLGGGMFLVMALALLAGGVLFQAKRGLDARVLERDRDALLAQLGETRERVDRMGEDLERLVGEGSMLRRAAGLDPLHPEVLEVGVGGPGSRGLDEHPLWGSNREVAAFTFATDFDLGALERRAQLHRESILEAGDSLRTHRDVLLATPSLLPSGGWISSSFSRSRLHPIHGRAMPHTGVDIAAPKGTGIRAAAEGTVARAGRWAGYGLVVEIDHGRGYRTLYAHASELLVRVGDEVGRGDLIARVGSTGTATAPHLHYEVIFNGRAQNPMDYVVGNFAP